MVGTKAGGLKAAATNKARHGDSFYADIGKRGGMNGHTGGFAANPELARIAGAKGGSISRRTSPSQPILDANRVKIFKLLAKGESLTAISRIIGVNYHTLAKYIGRISNRKG